MDHKFSLVAYKYRSLWKVMWIWLSTKHWVLLHSQPHTWKTCLPLEKNIWLNTRSLGTSTLPPKNITLVPASKKGRRKLGEVSICCLQTCLISIFTSQRESCLNRVQGVSWTYKVIALYLSSLLNPTTKILCSLVHEILNDFDPTFTSCSCFNMRMFLPGYYYLNSNILCSRIKNSQLIVFAWSCQKTSLKSTSQIKSNEFKRPLNSKQ